MQILYFVRSGHKAELGGIVFKPQLSFIELLHKLNVVDVGLLLSVPAISMRYRDGHAHVSHLGGVGGPGSRVQLAGQRGDRVKH